MFYIPFLTPRFPQPKSDYLVALSTPHGIMQHTMYNLPDPEHGYATDDNARALMVANLWKHDDPKNATLMRNLEAAYLRFLKFAQAPEGQIYCYVSFDLQKRRLGTGDWFGRSIFALSYLTFYSKKFSTVSLKILHKSLPLVYGNEFSLRTTAFLIMGFYYLLKHNEKKSVFKRYEVDRFEKTLRKWRDTLKNKAKENCSRDWYWPENLMSYDNGKVIQAYLILGDLLHDQTMLDIGQKMLEFYLKMTFKRGYFQAPGNHGFWVKNGKRPKYDEQGLESYSITSALVSAYRILKIKRYETLAQDSYRWFWGKNRLKKTLVERRTGAVYDALEKENLNDNQGAESYLSLNLAYFALTKKIHL